MKKYLKPILIALLLVLGQLIIYTTLKFIQTNPVALGNTIDDLIIFNKFAIYPYVLWYAAIFLIPLIFYISDEKTFNKYIYSYICVTSIAGLVFLIYPTTMVRPEVLETDFTSWLVNLIYLSDTPILNCLPSLHCAVCFLFIICSILCKNLKVLYKILIILMSLLIIISTVYVKQHVVIDILGSIIIVGISWIIISIIFKRNERKRSKAS